MRNRILIILSMLSFVLSQDGLNVEDLTLLNTIKDIKVTAFDIVGDRLYAIHPGTNSGADYAARLSIVNLTTSAVIAEGHDGSDNGGISGYPDKIAVFGNIVVIGSHSGFHFFNVSGDNIVYLGNDLITSSFDKIIMHMYKKDNYLYVTHQSTGFGVYNMTDPSNPVTVHEVDYGVTDYPYGIYATNDYIFLCDIDNDHDRPDSKVYIHNNGGSYDKIGTISKADNIWSPYRVAVHGNLLYTDKKTVHNISDPTNPVEISDHNYVGESSNGEMEIYGDYLYITGGGHKSWDNPRAWIYNIKDYTDIKTTFAFEDTVQSHDVKVVNNKVYFSFSGQRALGDLKGTIREYGDDTPPTISSVVLSSDNTTLAVTMSESVYNTNAGSGALEASDFIFALSGGVATLSSTTPTSITQEGRVYTLGIPLLGAPNGNETLTVNPVVNSIYDASGKVASTDQSNNSVKLNDNTPPTISNTTIANDNSTIAATFSELVYNATGGSGSLEVSDFTLSSTGGMASVAATPSSILINDKVVTLGLNVTGIPDGSEKLVVVPSSVTAIYDAGDNAASTSQSNNTVFMNDKAPPTVISISSTKDNATYGIGKSLDIYVTFSEGVNVTGNPQLTLETGENDATINFNSGELGDSTIYFNYVISEGDTSRDLDYVSTAALSVIDGSIKDGSGNTSLLVMPSPGETNSLGANKDLVIDGIRPIINNVTMTKRNETLKVKMSEPVYNTNAGSGELEISDFKYSLEDGTASLISFAPFTISKKDSTYTLDLKIQGYANGAEKLTVLPVDNSIYDIAGNEMLMTQDSNTVNLLETIPPMITSVSLVKDNSSIEVTMSEPSYSAENGSGSLEISDFIFTLKDGVAQLVSDNPSTISDSGNTYTLGLNLSTLADGNEKLTVSPVDSSIYDVLGNQSLTSQSNNEVNLYDFVVPIITQVSGVESNTLTATENVEIEIMVSEPIASVSINMSSVLGDSIVKSYTIQKDRINLTLSAPFTSGDSIRFDVISLTDLSSNVGVEKQYQYYVSILGDYNKDGAIDVLDLNNFTSAWEKKALSYEIGPVVGTAPHFKPNLDGIFNSRDGMVFYRMWHWDYGRIGKLEAKLGPNIGQNLNSRVNRDKFAIKPPEGTHGSEIIINYLPSEIRIRPSNQNNQNEMLMSLSKQDTLSGHLLTHQIHSFNNQILFDLFDLRVEKTLIAISYRYIDQDNQVIGTGYEEVLLSPVPEEFALHQNYPNPFNPITTIQYDIPIEGHVKLVIYDILGREVVRLIDQAIPAGYHTTVWDSKDNSGISMPGGVYFFQLQTRDYVKTFKMVLLK